MSRSLLHDWEGSIEKNKNNTEKLLKIAEDIYNTAYARGKASEERPQGEWGKWIIAEVQCPNCFEYFETDCYSAEELNKCPNCGADMRGDNND